MGTLMNILMDSSVLVGLERDELVLENLETLARGRRFCISVVTASEWLHAVHRGNRAQRRGTRARLVDDLLEVVPTVPIDMQIARMHSEIWADLWEAGRMIGGQDIWLGATAITRELTLVTRSVRGLDRIAGLAIERW